MVLDEYRGDTDRARREYKKILPAEIEDRRARSKSSSFGQSVLGGEEFVAWVKEKFIEGTKDRGRHSVKEFHRYCS